ncbi:MurR/RpiR family transcriptional regulator [Phyllobacterium phragmitis]|uniref:Transcriptional regulator HexR n=1 Tax=Phyllobacterium phragmitis TaxID=2670329 RepID=A0ABQ0H5W8_9HYPH
MTVSLLQRIFQEMTEMGAAEQRIANFVSTSPGEVIHMSMAKLSERCSVSDPTIMRFCRRFGFDGYQDFKLHLAQSLVPSAPFAYEQIIPNDGIENIVRKTCRNSLNAIQRALEDLVPQQIENAALLLRDATWTGIYASGISEVTAIDAEHKFQRLGMRCAAIMGRKKQWMHAESARPNEIALIFSQSGHTKQMVELAIAARAGGARVVSVTAADSPLARVTDALIAVRPYDQTELMTPLASRLNHHLVVNMLVTAIAVSSGSEFPDQLPALDSWLTDKIRD